MKRLLAYLFIVLGFGLTFNVSANAKEQKIPISYCEGRLYYGENCIYYYYKNFVFGETKLKSTILKSQPIRANIKKLCLNYSRLKASSLKTSSIIANEYRAIYKRHPKRGSARIPRDLTYPISLNPNTKHLLFQTNGECINVDRPNDKFINLTIQSSSSKPYNGWAIIKELSQTQIAKKEPTETQPDNDLEEEKKKMAEEKRKIEEEKRKKAAAKKKKEEEEQKRIAEAKK